MWKLSLLRAAQPATRFLGRGSGDTPARSPLSGKVRQGGGGPDWDGWMQTREGESGVAPRSNEEGRVWPDLLSQEPGGLSHLRF